jgi:cell division protease FtsH
MGTREYSDETARIIDEETNRILREAQDKCRSLLAEHRKALDLVAQALLEQETIEGAEVARLLEVGRTGGPPVPGGEFVTGSMEAPAAAAATPPYGGPGHAGSPTEPRPDGTATGTTAPDAPVPTAPTLPTPGQSSAPAGAPRSQWGEDVLPGIGANTQSVAPGDDSGRPPTRADSGHGPIDPTLGHSGEFG